MNGVIGQEPGALERGSDWRERAYARGIAGGENGGPASLKQGACLDVQTQFRHALRLVRAMALEAVVGQDRPDFPIEIDARLAVGGIRSETQKRGAKQNCVETNH